MVPCLVHARKARARIAETNKSDTITVRGLNMLQRTHSLPTIWVPPQLLRDLRELTRTRMYFVRMATGLKNRVHSELAKYGIELEGVSDIFRPRVREELLAACEALPTHTRFVTLEQLDYVDHLQEETAYFAQRIAEAFDGNVEVELVDSLPGIGFILAVVVWLEVGDVTRFNSPGALATYAGTTPRLEQSGRKLVLGGVRHDVNRYLKWAFVEAANVICLNQDRWSGLYATDLYRRVRDKRDHPKAIVAVARHLAESTYWVLTKHEPYRERGAIRKSSRGA